MQLTTAEGVKAALALKGCTDAQLVSLIRLASAEISAALAVTGYTTDVTAFTEYYDGAEHPDIHLRRWPVTVITNVWLDPAGNYGGGSAPFPASTLLTSGVDYSLAPNAARGSKLRRIMGSGAKGVRGYPPGLSPTYYPQLRQQAVWPTGTGNIKVAYSAGITLVPSDLDLAAIFLVSHLLQVLAKGGLQVQSERLGEYSYTLASGGNPNGWPSQTTNILNRYRRQPI